MTPRVPVTIVTGFLGAGKTTLIRRVIEEAGAVRFGLIVNEFGDLGFDGELLSDCMDPSCRDGVVELTNGCLCCTVADDFVPALTALLDRPEPPERIIIETSGLAFPQPLLAAFAWPSVRPRVTVDGVVTVVDGPAVASGTFAADPAAVDAARQADEALDHESPLEELYEDQLRAADLVIVTKLEDDDDRMAKVLADVAERVRPGVKSLTRPGAALFGIEARAEEDLASRAGHHGDLGSDEHGAHEHDDFDSRIVPMSFPDRQSAEACVRDCLAREGVLRIKGTVTIADKAAPLAVQGVGPRLETWFGRPGEPARGLVVIGLSPLPDLTEAAGREAA